MIRMSVIKYVIIALIILLAVLILLPTVNRPYGHPRWWTISHLKGMSLVMDCFHEDTSSWPDPKTWREQLRPYARSFSGISVAYDTIFLDPWGSEIEYAVNEAEEGPKRAIYSFGPNKRDEKGAGDDIVVNVEKIKFRNRKANTMKREEFRNELLQLRPNDRTRLDELALRIQKNSRECVEEAVIIWKEKNTEMSWKAGYILSRLEDLVMIPLIDTGQPSDILQRVWRIEYLADVQLSLRERIVTLLKSMFKDKTIVPFRTGPGAVEEPPEEKRVCDIAYNLVRKLIHFGESGEDHTLNESLFYEADFEQRDIIIDKFEKSQIWIDLVEEPEYFEDKEED